MTPCCGQDGQCALGSSRVELPGQQQVCSIQTLRYKLVGSVKRRASDSSLN